MNQAQTQTNNAVETYLRDLVATLLPGEVEKAVKTELGAAFARAMNGHSTETVVPTPVRRRRRIAAKATPRKARATRTLAGRTRASSRSAQAVLAEGVDPSLKPITVAAKEVDTDIRTIYRYIRQKDLKPQKVAATGKGTKGGKIMVVNLGDLKKLIAEKKAA